MKKTAIVLISAITAAGIIITLALTAVQLVAFDQKRYESAYGRFDRYDFIGISKDDLMQVTRDMLSYLKGSRPDLIMHADINGEYQQVFEERELLHMQDVRGIFLAGFLIRNIAAAVALAGIAALILLKKRGWLKTLCIAYLCATLAVAALLGSLFMAISSDFSDIFIKFHLMFFNNDLWLLDIGTDVLIQMFPEEFFGGMATAIAAWASAAVLVPGAASAIYFIVQKCRIKGDADAV